MHNSTNLLKPDWTSDGSVVYRGLVKCVGKDKNCLTKIPTKRKENPVPLPGFLFIANVRYWPKADIQNEHESIGAPEIWALNGHLE